MTTKPVTDARNARREESEAGLVRGPRPVVLARLTDIVEQAVRGVPAAVRREATIRLENAGAPDVIVSMGQVVWVVAHLLVHAARAARPGRPLVVVSRIAPGEAGMARLEIVLDGAGLDPQGAKGARGEWTDPGLAACHAIAASQGGRLTVASDAGTGSTLRLELPAATAA